MKVIHTILAVGLALGLTACGSADVASRNAPINSDVPFATASGQNQVVLAAQYNVTEIRIDVPRTLTVSEANLFAPIADIVWRGEAPGDRYNQIHAIFMDAFGAGTATMTSGPAVIVEATVKRFHSLSDKTRYTFGGWHNMQFDLTVRDAQTGAILDGPRFVKVDIEASGGSAAIEEERAGRTQRVVVVEALQATIRRELSRQVQETLTSRNETPLGVTTAQTPAQSL